MTTKISPLRDTIEKQLNLQWHQWAQAHPNLAAAIDRARLVESTMQQVRNDPAFQQAMRQADLDEAKLAAAMRVLERLEQAVRRVLPI